MQVKEEKTNEKAYKHFFTCEKCDAMYAFSSLEKIKKDSTWDSSCFQCGRVTLKFSHTIQILAVAI